jgi:hypothetical protein
MQAQLFRLAAVVAGLAAIGCGPSANAVRAAKDVSPVSLEAQLPASLRLTLKTLGCDVGSSALVFAEAGLDVSGAAVLVERRGDAPGDRLFAAGDAADPLPSHEVVSTVIEGDGEPMLRADMFVQLIEGESDVLTPRTRLGPCSAGGAAFELEIQTRAQATLRATALDCDLAEGQQVEVQGRVTFAGLSARLSFVEPSAGLKAPGRVLKTLDVPMIPRQHAMELAPATLRGPSLDAALWVSVVDPDGTARSAAAPMGGCRL